MADPVLITPVPGPEPRKTNWVPSQKALSAGIGGVIASTIAVVASKYGYPIPPEFLPYLISGITALLYYLVPASKKDIVRNLDNAIVAMAANDPTSPVSVQGIVHEVIKSGADENVIKAVPPPIPPLPKNDSRL